MVKLTRISPEKARPLAEVRDQVIAMWVEQQKHESALEAANALIARLPKENIETLAKDIPGAQVEIFPAVDRSGAVAESNRELSQHALDGLFSLEDIGSATVISDAESVKIIRLNSVTQPDPSQDPKALASVSQRTTDALADDLLREVTDALLLRRYDVDINRALIESVL